MQNGNYKKSNSYYDHKREEMLPFIPRGSRKILDIGCGSGEFANVIKKKLNAEVWGIELVKERGEEAKNKLDKVIVGDCFSSIDLLPENYFDCVILNDILEHLENPYDLLYKIKRVLKKDGYVVSSIPNVRYWSNLLELLINKEWKYREQGVLDSTHLRFFTEKSIRRMFEEKGYRIELLKGINPLNSMKYKILNCILCNFISDSKYLQFAVRARINPL